MERPVQRGDDLPSAELNDRLALNASSRMHGSDDLVPVFLQDFFLCAKEIVLCHLDRELIVNPEPSFSIQEEGREGPLVCGFG